MIDKPLKLNYGIKVKNIPSSPQLVALTDSNVMDLPTFFLDIFNL